MLNESVDGIGQELRIVILDACLYNFYIDFVKEKYRWILANYHVRK